MRAVLLAAGGLVAALAGTGTIPGPPAAAAETSHAALVVDTGTEVRRVCVGFTEAEITGKDLLDRAGVDPVYRSYGHVGTAVCSLCGVGCPPDESCLTCGGSDYWSYHRAPSGSGRFSRSPVGATSTKVRDGDVEGWRWGPGTAPAYVSFDEVCGVAATTTSAVEVTTTTVTTAAPAPPPAPGPRATVATTTTTATIATPTTTTTTTTEPDDVEETAAAPPPRPADEQGGDARSLAAFGVALGGLSGWIAMARRARRRGAAGG